MLHVRWPRRNHTTGQSAVQLRHRPAQLRSSVPRSTQKPAPASWARVQNHKPCQYIRGQGDMAVSAARSVGAQIICRGFAGSPVSNNIIREFLSLIEAVHASAFDSTDVHEHVFAAISRLDEAEALLAVEPLYGSLRHITLLSIRVWFGRAFAPAGRLIENWREVVSPTHCARRGQVVRPKLDAWVYSASSSTPQGQRDLNEKVLAFFSPKPHLGETTVRSSRGCALAFAKGEIDVIGFIVSTKSNRIGGFLRNSATRIDNADCRVLQPKCPVRRSNRRRSRSPFSRSAALTCIRRPKSGCLPIARM